jgi:hypothetical protein
MLQSTRRSLSRLAGIALVVAVATLSVARPARAQDPTMPDSLAMMQEFMGPMMGSMMSNMMDAMLTLLARPESAEKLATFTRNYYEALRRKGFTDEQALRLTAAIGFPAMGGGN